MRSSANRTTSPFDLLRLAPTIVNQAVLAVEASIISSQTLKEALSYLSQDLLSFTLPNVITALLQQCELYL
jgi:hypothetical protein